MIQDRSNLAELSPAQRAALRYAEVAARSREADAGDRLSLVLQRRMPIRSSRRRNAMETVRSYARVVLHFHPDRYGLRPITVAESLLADGRYRNQFETGLSGGSRTAFAGGSRDRWERDLFGGAYHRPGILAEERPKYRVLELIRAPAREGWRAETPGSGTPQRSAHLPPVAVWAVLAQARRLRSRGLNGCCSPPSRSPTKRFPPQTLFCQS